MSTTYFVTRHPGALEWIQDKGFTNIIQVSHWTVEHTEQLEPGDTVIGILPIDIAHALWTEGARYMALIMPTLPKEWLGKELSADEMDQAGARVVPFIVMSEMDYMDETGRLPVYKTYLA